MMNNYRIGIDIGSTTIKIVLVDDKKNIIFSDYRRHNADIKQAFLDVFNLVYQNFGEITFYPVITGSAGLGMSEKFDIPFVQEVVAASEVIKQKYPQIKTLIDIGGEDAKMIFFSKNRVPDIRMNGSCAGGTGAFIDQMASLLGITLNELNELASNYSHIHPIASRCGVFTKTDIQNLVAKNVSREDIAASIFNAVAMQTISSLSRGHDIETPIFFCGGPFAYLSELKKVFANRLNINEHDYVLSDNAQFIPAWGCTLAIDASDTTLTNKTNIKNNGITISDFLKRICDESSKPIVLTERLNPLFSSEHEYKEWCHDKEKYLIKLCNIDDISEDEIYFIGIDSGSTTTKIVVMDSQDNIVYSYYTKNNGDPLNAIKNGLDILDNRLKEHNKKINIKRSAVTGYGEDLVKAAYSLDYGIVETIAHYTAAKKFDPEVSFVLDIGGQDMKAIFVTNGGINRLEINEACSSGCGSFIEGFANTLNYSVNDFAELAALAEKPCDLGTRCTVFMNSKVKQFLREGTEIADIAAGLSYSVIKNCLYKVLKIKDVKELGEHIIVQGGTFRNRSIVRALEKLTGKNVIFTNIPELMGAFGAAIYAKLQYQNTFIEIKETKIDVVSENNISDNSDAVQENIAEQNEDEVKSLPVLKKYTTKQFFCKGCENQCLISRMAFEDGAFFITGNKCEKIYTNRGSTRGRGENHYAFKLNLLSQFTKRKKLEGKMTIGIPRALNMYENFPFWSELFYNCGINVELSSNSTFKQYERGIASIMSDNICFPAKLVHGHVHELLDKGVDRIFYPFVVYEVKEHPKVVNSFNCPVVTGYGEVLKSSMMTDKKYGIPIDNPVINFDNIDLLKKSCYNYLKELGVQKKIFNDAFDKALEVFSEYKQSLKKNCERILNNAKNSNRTVILVAGRPYHTDQLIQHKLTDMIVDFDVDVISDDYIRMDDYSSFTDLNTVSQWTYTNRIMRAAQYVAESKDNIHFIEITSFGCGPDAFILDEVSAILKRAHKALTILKVDDVSNIGSLRLRVRSFLETISYQDKQTEIQPVKKLPAYEESDKLKTILVPYFADMYSPFIPTLFNLMGYKLVNLPPSDEKSIEFGLRYANNEICYPATLVIGDIIKALNSGQYDLRDIVIGMTQTGGQCRASNYIMLIKKALIDAGYQDIPVISIAFSSGLYDQQAFKLKYKSNIRIAVYTLLYADTISKFYYSAAAHENEPGAALKLRDKYIEESLEKVQKKDVKGLLDLLSQAVNDFNSIVDKSKKAPKIGIVGEIYVKYNKIGHKHIVDWLIEQNIEVVVPPLLSFFIQWFVNNRVNIHNNIKEKGKWNFLAKMIKELIDRIINKIDNIANKYVLWQPFGDIDEEAEEAKKVITLAAQFGEGWLIPAEISHFAKQGVKNVVSLQPFGCIANHIISKGVEKKIREVFDGMNLLFLDFDSGVSDVNVHNRLHFMIKNAKEQCME